MMASLRPLHCVARSCLASVAVSALVAVGAAAPASAASVPMTLSSTGGPTGGGNTIIGSVAAVAGDPGPFPGGTIPTVQFQYLGTGSSGCRATARPVAAIAVEGVTATDGVLTVDPEHVKRISGTKIAFQAPAESYPESDINPNGLVLAGAQTAAKWNVCVYDSDSPDASTLLATAHYTVVLRPTITSIVPDSSPARGGQSITVNGAGFTALSGPISASIGGAPLTDIRVAANGASFTATTGPRAAGTGLPLTVTTPGGTVSSLNPDGDDSTGDPPIPFSYSNGITISPATAPVGGSATIDVLGAGFSRLTFEPGVPTNSLAHVFLVNGAYESSSNRGIAECKDVAVISDTELICTLDLWENRLNPSNSLPVPGTPIAEGAYTLTVVENGAIGTSDANPTIVSSGSTFTVGPY